MLHTQANIPTRVAQPLKTEGNKNIRGVTKKTTSNKMGNQRRKQPKIPPMSNEEFEECLKQMPHNKTSSKGAKTHKSFNNNNPMSLLAKKIHCFEVPTPKPSNMKIGLSLFLEIPM